MSQVVIGLTGGVLGAIVLGIIVNTPIGERKPSSIEREVREEVERNGKTTTRS